MNQKIDVNVIKAATHLDRKSSLRTLRLARVFAACSCLVGTGAMLEGKNEFAQYLFGGTVLLTLLSTFPERRFSDTFNREYFPSEKALGKVRSRMQAVNPDSEVVVGYDFTRV